MKKVKCILEAGFIILIASLFSSCSSNLTRNNAEAMIREKFHLPGTETRNLNLGFEAQYYSIDYDKLENEGLLVLTKMMGGNIDHSTLTEKAKEYAVGNVQNSQVQIKVAVLEFGEITGIVEQKGSNIAEVKYNLVRKNITPFGQAFKLNEGTISKEIIFTKYDDGWRIEN